MIASGLAPETFNRDWVNEQWSDAAGQGTLLIRRHHPSGLALTWGGYRSVLTPELAANLQGFITSGNYKIDYFHQTVSGHGPYYFVLTPTDPQFTVVGSGVLSRMHIPTGDCDRLVVVSGKDLNWHIHAEESNEIAQSITDGKLTFLTQL